MMLSADLKCESHQRQCWVCRAYGREAAAADNPHVLHIVRPLARIDDGSFRLVAHAMCSDNVPGAVVVVVHASVCEVAGERPCRLW